ncbi:MAG: LysM peptidoglycan-binding domain-containing protein [Opitutaceae bacterium]|nr:LysM peptidoglycan-binding domain-containing protein [Opitutaceae bacterium]
MRLLRISPTLIVPAVLALSGCGYVHVGRIPAPAPVIVGDEKLLKENSDLRAEKKLLQQELGLTRAQGDALRMAIENRAADGDTSRRLVDRLNETSRELATLRANYARLQTERNQAVASAAESGAVKARLGATEEKLANSLRTFTELQEEITRLRADVARSRDENAGLSEQVKVITAKNEQAQAALAQLNTELLVQKNSRLEAEQDAELLRTELKTVAPNSSVLARQRTGAAGDARSLVAEHAAETAALTSELAGLRSRVTSLEAERSQLQQQLVAAERPAAALATAQSQLSAAAREKGKLFAEKSELENQVARLQAAASPAQVLRDQLRDVQARAAALTEENAKLKTRLATSGGATPAAATAETARVEKPAVVVEVKPAAPAPTPAPERVATPTVVVEASRIDLGSTGTPPEAGPAQRGSSPVMATFVTSAPGSARGPGGSRPEANGQRLHTVSGGDTLAKISAQYYGTPARWADILAANRDVLGETNNLVVGRTLRIP